MLTFVPIVNPLATTWTAAGRPQPSTATCVRPSLPQDYEDHIARQLTRCSLRDSLLDLHSFQSQGRLYAMVRTAQQLVSWATLRTRAISGRPSSRLV